MAQEVVGLLFPGDSRSLLTRYAEGARRFEDGGGTPPERLVVAHCDEGLHVTLVWGDGVDHELLGRHMLGLLSELEMPFPDVHHGRLATTSWQDLTAAAGR